MKTIGMGNHATALAKHKIQLAQVHLRAALEALKDEQPKVMREHLQLAAADMADAERLAE